MKWLADGFALLACGAGAGTVHGWRPSTSMTPTPDDRAKQWLALVDDQNYAEAYKQMGAMARGKIWLPSNGQKARVAFARLWARCRHAP